MNRTIRLLSSLAALLLLLLAASSNPAGADGIAFPELAVEGYDAHEADVEMPAQKAILVYDEESQREDLILSVELKGGPEAAWVVPVPSLPEVETARPEWFEQLSDMTKPRVEHLTKTIYRKAGGPETVGEVVAVGVEVISREEVGVYDVSILSADKPGALVDWLNENGYAYPEEGEPLLDAYMEEGGWYFVAARVLPEESARLNGDVRPLWFSFNTERPIYPMRLTSLVKSSLHVLIYVLADHRMEIPRLRFETEFAGELALNPFHSPEIPLLEEESLVDLLTQRPYYVSKLRNEGLSPSSLTEDIYFEQSASDKPLRKVVYETTYRYVDATDTAEPSSEVSGWLGTGLTLVLILALGLICWWGLRPDSGGEA